MMANYVVNQVYLVLLGLKYRGVVITYDYNQI